jgi:glycosyltransferase involved in cell wall biosynthesis
MSLRILHITPLYPNPERPMLGTFVKTQIESLEATGEVKSDVLILPGMRGIAPYLGFIPTIRRAVKNGKYDVLHVHYGNAASLVKMINCGKLPLVTSYCGDDLLGKVTPNALPRLKSRLFRKLNIYLSRYDRTSIVKSALLSDQIRGTAPVIEIIPNGVDVEVFKPLDRLMCRQQLGIDNDRKIILFAGDINNPNKNFGLLKKALSALPEESYRIITLGPKGIPHKDMPVYMNAADLVACTSLYEGSPNTVKEAMACNARVFSTPCGDVPWLLDGAAGSKVIGYDDAEWTKNLRLLIGGELDSEIQGSRSELIRKQLDTHSVAKKLIKIYYQCLNR